MPTMNLEAMKVELAQEILSTESIEVVSKLRRAYQRILKSEASTKNEWPSIGPSTLEEALSRIDSAMAQTGGTPSKEVFNEIRHRVQ